MKLPNGQRAIVDERKVREYLVSPSHPIGRFKAPFFARLGFGPGKWRELAVAIGQIAATGDAELADENEYGRKYVISGVLAGPSGRSSEVVTVWILKIGTDIPRLVTVYPR